jgi:hypothetical protein
MVVAVARDTNGDIMSASALCSFAVFATFWAVGSYELHLSQYEWNALRGKG